MYDVRCRMYDVCACKMHNAGCEMFTERGTMLRSYIVAVAVASFLFLWNELSYFMASPVVSLTSTFRAMIRQLFEPGFLG